VRRRRERLAAVPARAAVQADLGDDGLDRRQLDAVVDRLERLVDVGQSGRAVRATRGLGLDDAIGIAVQLSSYAGATVLPPFAERRLVGLVSVRGRDRRVVRRLGRLAQLRLKLGDPRRQLIDPRQCVIQARPKRHDQRIFLRVRKSAEVGNRRKLSHRHVDSYPPTPYKKKTTSGVK